MPIRRLTLGLAAATAAVAWLSAAGWSSAPDDPPAPAAPAAAHEDTEPLVIERTRRLRERLAAAPRPADSSRNPFEFHDVRHERVRAPGRARPGAAGDQPAPAPELPFVLIGIATHVRPDGPVRTAVLATRAGDIVMAAAGDVIVDRYTVVSIDDQRVDVSDLDTGRRDALRLDVPVP